MPFYEYICLDCKKQFSRIRPMICSAQDDKCDCGGVGKRIISPVYWRPFVGSVTYDKKEGYPPGTSAADFKNE